jgi:hypothetical protein
VFRERDTIGQRLDLFHPPFLEDPGPYTLADLYGLGGHEREKRHGREAYADQ